jgi:hypothetical protein
MANRKERRARRRHERTTLTPDQAARNHCLYLLRTAAKGGATSQLWRLVGPDGRPLGGVVAITEPSLLRAVELHLSQLDADFCSDLAVGQWARTAPRGE